MTEAKRKADELYAKFLEITANDSVDNPTLVMKRPINMALLCVEEIIDTNPIEVRCLRDYEETISLMPFWQEVKEELNKMK